MISQTDAMVYSSNDSAIVMIIRDASVMLLAMV